MEKKSGFSIKSIVAIGIGAALFFVLGRFVAIPTPIPNTTANVQYGVLSVFAVIFGPVVGLFGAFIGHILIDLSWGSPWWSWIIASGVFGALIGLSKRFIHIENGKSGLKEILIFNAAQIIAHGISWVIVAPILDIVIYKEPTEKLIAQGLGAWGLNAVTTAIVGTLLLLAYSKTRTKAGSLQKED